MTGRVGPVVHVARLTEDQEVHGSNPILNFSGHKK